MLATLEGETVRPNVAGWQSAFEYNDEATQNPYGFGTTLGSYQLGFIRKTAGFLWRKTRELVSKICSVVKKVAKTVYTISGLKTIVNMVAKGAQFIGSALQWFYDVSMRMLYRFVYMLTKKTIRNRYVDNTPALGSDDYITPEQAGQIVEYGNKVVQVVRDPQKLKNLQGLTVATIAGTVALYITPIVIGFMAGFPALVPFLGVASKLIFAMITTAVAFIVNEMVNFGLDALGLTPDESDLDDSNRNSPSYAQLRIAEYDFYKASLSTGDEIVVGEIVRKELNRASPFPLWIYFQIEQGQKVWYCRTVMGVEVKIDENLTIEQWLSSLNEANNLKLFVSGKALPTKPGERKTLITVIDNPALIAGFQRSFEERRRKERMQSLIIPALALTALTLAGS